MLRSVSLLLLTALAFQAQAKVDASQAARLEQDLTPLGGERAGNASGTIPAWTGGLATPPANYQPGMHHPDPYAGDELLYRVDSQNLAQYEQQLPLGLKTLLQQNPSFYLRVFPTRRSAAAPQRIYDATRFNALNAELIAGGNGVQGAAAGVPFPLPQNGQEAIWNHVMRYRGDQVSMVTNQAAVLANGSYNLLKLERDIYFVYGREGVAPQDLDNTLFYYKYKVVAPAKLAGYEWQLLGKREMLVPYNSYAVHKQGIAYGEILPAKHINPELLRYELHRVWVVEANLRTGFSHPYGKRRFYLDEDSWQILAVDLYDRSGNLIGLQEAHPISYYDVPMFGSTLETVYDLKGGRYFVDGLDNNEKMYDFNARLSPRDFTPQALRREGN